MNITIKPSILNGKIKAPPSKSYTHRAMVAASLADGNSYLKNALLSDDTNYTIKAFQLLGAGIEISENNLKIKGTGGDFPIPKSPLYIYCGNSGTTLRFIASVAALVGKKVILDGDLRLKKRPIKDLVYALKSLGVRVEFEEKKTLPILIDGGKIKGGHLTISGEKSSQFVSSLLLVSPYFKNGLRLHAVNQVSQPYIEITLEVMKSFGVRVWRKNNSYLVNPQHYKGREYKIEGDYSSASYFFAAAAITGGKVTVSNLNTKSIQGDRYLLSLLTKMGCHVLKDKNSVTVRGGRLKSLTIDMSDYPDLVPTLSILAAKASGKTIIKEIRHLRFKETDRIKALGSQLSKFGIETQTTDNSLIIFGGRLKGTKVETYNDHRMAMSFSIASLVADGHTLIKNAEVVNKSYPTFYDDLKKLGANFSRQT